MTFHKKFAIVKENLFSSPLKVKLKVFEKNQRLKFSKLGQSSRSKIKITWRARSYRMLSQEIHMCTLKEPLLLWKLWLRFKLLKSCSRSKVKKVMVPCERSYHKLSTSAVSRPLLVWKLTTRLIFFHSMSKVKVTTWQHKNYVPCERSCHKENTCDIWTPYFYSFEVIAKV